MLAYRRGVNPGARAVASFAVLSVGADRPPFAMSLVYNRAAAGRGLPRGAIRGRLLAEVRLERTI